MSVEKKRAAQSSSVDAKRQKTKREDDFDEYFESVRKLETPQVDGRIHDALVQERLMMAAAQQMDPSSFSQDDDGWLDVRNRVLAKLKNRHPDELVGYQDQREQLYLLLEHTVRDREGTSSMIVGPRGVGKTTLVNHVLKQLEEKYSGEYITIRISGAVHFEERLAIKEILKQLEVHISRLCDERPNLLTGSVERRTLNDTMSRLLKILQGSGAQNNIPIVFMIDEIDVYLADTKQTLLYNLFEFSQGRDHSATPVSIIGITTKTHARESLEKRVKSRFSQQLIQMNRPRQLSHFMDIVAHMLLLSDPNEFAEQYNKLVTDQLRIVGSSLRKRIVSVFHTTRSIKDIKNWLIPVVCNITDSLEGLKFPEVPQKRLTVQEVVLNALSDLELKLLICGCRCLLKEDMRHINFQTCYDEYVAMSKQSGIELQSRFANLEYGMGLSAKLPIWSKELCIGSWENLIKNGLVMDVVTYRGELTNATNSNNNNGWISQDAKLYYFEVDLQELKKILSSTNNPNVKWCRI